MRAPVRNGSIGLESFPDFEGILETKGTQISEKPDSKSHHANRCSPQTMRQEAATVLSGSPARFEDPR